MRNGHRDPLPLTPQGGAGDSVIAAMPAGHRWTLIGLSAFLLFLGLVPRELWGVDEPLVGTIIREMVVDGQWLVPHLNGAVYTEKPPLYFWLSALPALLTGTLIPLWLRLPSTLSAIGCLWLTYRMGGRLFSARAGLLAAGVLATSLLFALSSQITRMDMPLTLILLAALYCFIRFTELEEESSAAAGRWALAIYPLVGLSFLTKGPIGPVIPAFIVGSVVLWQRDWRAVMRLRPFTGTLLALAVVLPWLIPAVLQAGMGYAEVITLQQSFGRAINSFSHGRPMYYYIYTFPVTILPWLLFLPAAFLWLWHQRETLGWRHPFLVSWTLGLFLFLSVMSGKLVIYLLPLFPGLALIVGGWWAAWWGAKENTSLMPTGRETRGSSRWLGRLTVAAIALYPVAAIVAAAGHLLPPHIPSWAVIGAGVASALAGVVTFLAVRQPRPLRFFAALTVAAALALSCTRVAIVRLDDVEAPTRLGAFLREYKDDVKAMAIYKVRPGLLNFYAEHRFDDLETPEQVRSYLAQSEPALCVIDDRALPHVWTALPPELQQLGEADVGRLHFVVIANGAVRLKSGGDSISP
ncbi:MAG TPA: glycosyltransferase family 39 protein [Nitrospiria bacterium]|nr:glycosyltransferase family 39 protein [Nitrospiria bacterium]